MTITWRGHSGQRHESSVPPPSPCLLRGPPTRQAGPEDAAALSLTPTFDRVAVSTVRSDIQMTSVDEEAPHIAAIQRSVDAGFRFLHLRDADGRKIAAINAERTRGGVVETYTIQAMDQAVAARFRAEDYPNGDPLWQQHGTVEEVVTALLELPPPGAPGAPNRTRRRPSGLWLPGEG